ncbi:hypothetical protein VNO77_38882 [Canavalia gladiata]|uniref:Uncharacterized protein n=1 Tax=Canavalia gladiata TaxID=3824 RepID=A0AAN9KDD4_CANGL
MLPAAFNGYFHSRTPMHKGYECMAPGLRVNSNALALQISHSSSWLGKVSKEAKRLAPKIVSSRQTWLARRSLTPAPLMPPHRLNMHPHSRHSPCLLLGFRGATASGGPFIITYPSSFRFHAENVPARLLGSNSSLQLGGRATKL